MRKAIILFIILILGTSPFCGCIDKGTGILIIRITDKPPDLIISEALVTISLVEIHRAGLGNNEDNETFGGWITLDNKSKTFDLIFLQNLSDILTKANLTVGLYTQVRLYVEKAIVTINNTEHNLKIPSKIVKIITNILIFDESTTTILLDFDVHKSIQKVGYDQYIFNPTIKLKN